MKELSNRENINLEYEWYEKHRLKITAQDKDVQHMLDSMDIVVEYEFPPIRIRYPRSNFEDQEVLAIIIFDHQLKFVFVKIN